MEKKFNLEELKIGESKTFDSEGYTNHQALRGSISSSAFHTYKKTGAKFSTKAVEIPGKGKGIEVTRLK
jgi:hypothetical protein